MATRQLFQLRDRRAEDLTGPVVPHKNWGSAIRMFEDVLANRDTSPGQYPRDYELLFVGTQNTDTGEITGGVPQIIATGDAWLEEKNEREMPSLIQATDGTLNALRQTIHG